MLNMLPKLELVPIMMYLRMLANVRRPSSTPSCSTLQVVLEQDHVRRLLGHVHGCIDRQADIRRVQRRRIVDAVAEVADHVAARLQREDDPVLLRRVDAAEQIHRIDAGLQRMVANCAISAPLRTPVTATPSVHPGLGPWTGLVPLVRGAAGVLECLSAPSRERERWLATRSSSGQLRLMPRRAGCRGRRARRRIRPLHRPPSAVPGDRRCRGRRHHRPVNTIGHLHRGCTRSRLARALRGLQARGAALCGRCETRSMPALELPAGDPDRLPGGHPGTASSDRVVRAFAGSCPCAPSTREIGVSDGSLHPSARHRPSVGPQSGWVDVLLPVPVTPSAPRKRGYDQAALIAAVAAVERLGLPHLRRSSSATRDVAQFGLDRHHRATNVRGAFRLTGPGSTGPLRASQAAGCSSSTTS